MNNSLHRFSAATVSFARRIEAGFDLIVALFFVAAALWLTLFAGLNWLTIGLDVILGLGAAGFLVRACETYATSRSPERPDEQERYRRSRSLYIPGDRHKGGRRERES